MKPEIRCNDNLEELRGMPDESIDLIVTDPPYGTSYSTNFRKKENAIIGYKGITCDTDECIIPKMDEMIKEMHRVLKPDSHVYMFTKWNKLKNFIPVIEKRFNLKNVIVWKKNNWSMGDLKGTYASQYEPIIFAHKGRKYLNCLEGKCRHSDVMEFDRVAGNEQLHAHQKPTDLLEFLIKKSSDEGEVVLDPFAGSGSTCEAARNLGRKSICIDQEPRACKIMEERLQ